MFPLLLLVLFIVLSFKDYRKIPFYLIISIILFSPVNVLEKYSIIRLLFSFVIVYGITYRKKCFASTKIDKYVFVASAYPIAASVFVALFASSLTFGEQLSHIRGTVYELAAFWIIWKLRLSTTDFYKCNKYIMILVPIICLYGIFEYFTKSHPYLTFINNFSAVDLVSRADFSIQDARGALSGRITGVAPYTIQYGALMLILLLYVISTCAKDYSKFVLLGTSLLLLSNLYLTGSRGPIVSLAVPAFLYYAKTLSIQKKILGIILLIFAYYFLDRIDAFSLASDDLHGSSTDGRLEQLDASIYFMMSRDGFLFGNGAGYSSSLIDIYSKADLGGGEFEGVLLYGLVDYGVLGLFLVFFVKLFVYLYLGYKAYAEKMINKTNLLFLTMILSAFTINALIVGEAYSNLFFIVYLMVLKYLTLQTRVVYDETR